MVGRQGAEPLRESSGASPAEPKRRFNVSFYWTGWPTSAPTALLARSRMARSSSGGTGQISTICGSMFGTDRIRNKRQPSRVGLDDDVSPTLDGGRGILRRWRRRLHVRVRQVHVIVLLRLVLVAMVLEVANLIGMADQRRARQAQRRARAASKRSSRLLALVHVAGRIAGQSRPARQHDCGSTSLLSSRCRQSIPVQENFRGRSRHDRSTCRRGFRGRDRCRS